VDVGEGPIGDLAHGHVPKLFREMGGPAEWRHTREGFLRKAVIAGAVVGTADWLLRRRRSAVGPKGGHKCPTRPA
jgi:hypothetical protein